MFVYKQVVSFLCLELTIFEGTPLWLCFTMIKEGKEGNSHF